MAQPTSPDSQCSPTKRASIPWTQLRCLAAAYARVLSSTTCPQRSEGAGNAGRLVRPQPRVVVENTRVSHHGHTRNTRHSPRNGFNGVLRARPGDRASLPPSPAQRVSVVAKLMSASGHQAHTTSPSASPARLSRQKRPSHPRPTFRDDRDTPLLGGRGRGGLVEMICPSAQGEIFAGGTGLGRQITQVAGRELQPTCPA